MEYRVAHSGLCCSVPDTSPLGKLKSPLLISQLLPWKWTGEQLTELRTHQLSMGGAPHLSCVLRKEGRCWRNVRLCPLCGVVTGLPALTPPLSPGNTSHQASRSLAPSPALLTLPPSLSFTLSESFCKTLDALSPLVATQQWFLMSLQARIQTALLLGPAWSVCSPVQPHPLPHTHHS